MCLVPRSRNDWLATSQDPRSTQYNPYSYPLSSTTFASVRGGVNFGNVQLALFIDNLLDSRTITNYSLGQLDANNPGTSPSPQQNSYTFRPRTIGITATYRR